MGRFICKYVLQFSSLRHIETTTLMLNTWRHDKMKVNRLELNEISNLQFDFFCCWICLIVFFYFLQIKLYHIKNSNAVTIGPRCAIYFYYVYLIFLFIHANSEFSLNDEISFVIYFLTLLFLLLLLMRYLAHLLACLMYVNFVWNWMNIVCYDSILIDPYIYTVHITITMCIRVISFFWNF